MKIPVTPPHAAWTWFLACTVPALLLIAWAWAWAGQVLSEVGLWWSEPLQHLPAPAWSAQAVLLQLLVYPALEEWVFRAGLLGYLLQIKEQSSKEIPLFSAFSLYFSVTALFCVVHAAQHGLEVAVAVAAPSMLLCHLYARWRSWLMVASIHACWNATYLLYWLVVA